MDYHYKSRWMLTSDLAQQAGPSTEHQRKMDEHPGWIVRYICSASAMAANTAAAAAGKSPTKTSKATVIREFMEE